MFDNRIVVESPGKLPGLVRADNIRNTHFSRNPKIAEFLKAYNYVKEYGEGVDRMYREMSDAGLQEPQYYTNAFLLQTVIYNVKKEKSVFNSISRVTDVEKLSIQDEKLTIQGEKLTIQGEKLSIQNEKLSIQGEKLTIEMLKSAIKRQNYSEPTIKNIIAIYDVIETNQIFGAPEIESILRCSMSTSKGIMRKLRDLEVVKSVQGMGKGKYRFVYNEEMER